MWCDLARGSVLCQLFTRPIHMKNIGFDWRGSTNKSFQVRAPRCKVQLQDLTQKELWFKPVTSEFGSVASHNITYSSCAGWRNPAQTGLIFDHRDALSRLSAPAPECCPVEEPRRFHRSPSLSGPCCRLLREGVTGQAAAWQRSLRGSPGPAEELRAFLGSPFVRSREVWTMLFNAKPPRGCLARLARRAGVSLHDSEGPCLSL